MIRRPPLARWLTALDLAAAALILVHNHPSGDPTPPKEEITVPRGFVEAAQPLGFTVHNRLIIGSARTPVCATWR